MSVNFMPNIVWCDSTGSTNVDARDSAFTHGTMVATTNQVSGRGRMNREWVCPPGKSLAMSLVVELSAFPSASSVSWVPLLAGVAMADVIRVLGASAAVKWPNDVLIGDKKVAGVLCELTGDGRIIIGVGVNWALTTEDLPTDAATSLNLVGVETEPKDLAVRWRRAVLDLVEQAVDADMIARVTAASATIGRSVRIEFPSGETDRGIAVALGDDGSLEVDCASGRRRVTAADVTHLRPNG